MSDQKAELDRVYTVPLSRAWITARHKRTRRAVNILREFAEKHMKSSEIKIDTDLNELLWKRGITKPPRRITVRMEKDEDGIVTISLPKKVEEEKAEVPSVEVKEEEKQVQVEPEKKVEAPAKAAAAKKARKSRPKKPKKEE